MFDSKNLKKRIISALIMLVAIISILSLGGILFYCSVILITLLMLLEGTELLNSKPEYQGHNKYLGFLFLYIALPFASLIALKENIGIDAILFIIAIVVATDSFAFFGGKMLGGIRLAPKISPNKTVSGSCCGILASIVISSLAYLFTKNISFISFITLGIFFSIIAQLGDLLESFFKRKLSVKDSGYIIPGHGGIFDRVDSFLLLFPTSYLVLNTIYPNIF